jgi:transcriptional regulator with XRE-family HTH domain
VIYSTKMLRALRAEIGANIHAARVRRKFVLGRLAQASGVPQDKIDRYELGKNEIRLDELLRIACALDMTVAGLIDERCRKRWDDFADGKRLSADFSVGREDFTVSRVPTG